MTKRTLPGWPRRFPAASKLLAQAKVQAICYGCLAGGFIKGPGHDQEIIRDIEAAAGIPGVAAAAAVVDALRAMGVTRVSVAALTSLG